MDRVSRNELLALVATCVAGCTAATVLLGGLTLGGAADVLSAYWGVWFAAVTTVLVAAVAMAGRRSSAA